MMPKRTSKVLGERRGEGGIKLMTFYGTIRFCAYIIIGKLLRERLPNSGMTQWASITYGLFAIMSNIIFCNH